MRRRGYVGTYFCLTLVLLAAPGLAWAADPVAAEYHCAGLAALAADTNLVAFQRAQALPSAGPVRALALSRLSSALASSWQWNTNAPAGLEPLARDVLAAESFGAVDRAPTNHPGFVMALHLDAQRATAWHDSLDKISGEAGHPWAGEGFSGWRWKIGASDSFWMMPARDWLVVGRGEGRLPCGQIICAPSKAMAGRVPP